MKRKSFWKWMLFVILLLALTGCGREKRLSGEVTAVSEDHFRLTDSEGREYVVQLTDESYIFSWIDGVTQGDFLAGEREGIFVTVSYDKVMGKYRAGSIQIDGLRTRNAMQLSDGTSIDILEHMDSRDYMLEDGTVLLYESIPIGPENVHAGGSVSFDDLKETAQKNIRAYFDEKGLYYEIPALLEEAYTAYTLMGAGSFQARNVRQDIIPTASNDRIICFLTDVVLPGWTDYSTNIREGAVFDIETGEHISGFDLFSCTQEELEAFLIDRIDPEGAYDRETISLELKPENILLQSDGGIEICFQECRIPEHAENLILGLSPEEAAEILQPWAVMETAETTP